MATKGKYIKNNVTKYKKSRYTKYKDGGPVKQSLFQAELIRQQNLSPTDLNNEYLDFQSRLNFLQPDVQKEYDILRQKKYGNKEITVEQDQLLRHSASGKIRQQNKPLGQKTLEAGLAAGIEFIPGIGVFGSYVGKPLTKKLVKGTTKKGIGNIFKSEIDWAKWNPETPKYPELINEYNAIEESTKKAGTWMKNPDGSVFQGTPEQFIQQQSSYFKKAFPEGYNEVWRGEMKGNKPELQDPTSPYYSKPIFTADRKLAESYTYSNLANKNTVNKNTIFSPNNLEEKYGLYNLAHKKSSNSLTLDGLDQEWSNLRFTDLDQVIDELNYNIDAQKKLRTKIESGIKNKTNILTGEPEEITPWHSEHLKNINNRLDFLENKLSIIKSSKGKSYVDNPVLLNDIRKEFSGQFIKDINISTDDVAKYIDKKGIDYVTLKNIHDGGYGNVSIVRHQPRNYLKSLQGNVGFFDMNNPNIYKSLIGLSIGNMGRQNNVKKYKDGGPTKKLLKPKTWMVSDYSQYKTRGEAYAAARKAGEKEFIWNYKKYTTESDMPPEQQMKVYGITDKQRLRSNIIRDRIDNNLQDFEYHDRNQGAKGDPLFPIKKMKRIIIDNEKETDFLNINGEVIPSSYSHKDLLSLYLGKPQKHNTVSVSKYVPSDSKNKNKEYFSINSNEFNDYILRHSDEAFLKEGLMRGGIQYARDKKGNIIPNRYLISDIGTGLGQFTIGFGNDDNGKYISYWDKWDLNPYKGKYSTANIFNIGDISMGIGKPFEIYDRIYYKDNPDINKYKEYDDKINELWNLGIKTQNEKYIDEANKLYPIRNSYYYKQNKYQRQYYSDKELSELDVNKRNFDTLALQRELSNRGYKLPKSTKEDGSFDGIWGDETKTQLLQFQEDMKKQNNIPEYGLGGVLTEAAAGAGTGAMSGAAFGGIGALPGALIGGAVGLIKGLAGEVEANKERKVELMQRNAQIQSMQSQGSVNNYLPTFKFGGVFKGKKVIKPNAEVEGNEMVLTPDGNMGKVKGPSHEKGGVKVNLPGGSFVFSKRVKVEGGKSAAEIIENERLNSKINRTNKGLEGSGTRLNKNSLEQNMTNYTNRIKDLAMKQEESKTPSFAKGGKIPKYQPGGLFKPVSTDYVSNPYLNMLGDNLINSMGGYYKYPQLGLDPTQLNPNLNFSRPYPNYWQNYPVKTNSGNNFRFYNNPGIDNTSTTTPVPTPVPTPAPTPALVRAFNPTASAKNPYIPSHKIDSTTLKNIFGMSPNEWSNYKSPGGKQFNSMFGYRMNNFMQKASPYVGAVAEALPSIYNIVQGLRKTQELNPRDFYNPYNEEIRNTMRNRRFNIDPTLQANMGAQAVNNYNIRQAGTARGEIMGNMGAAQNARMAADAAAFAQKQNMDNQYMAEQAQMDYGLGRDMAQTKFNIQDVNDRNIAARDAFLAQAATGIQQRSLVNRQMDNQAAQQQLLIEAIGAYSPYANAWIPGMEEYGNRQYRSRFFENLLRYGRVW